MNILFYTRFYPDPHFGGIERVTSVLSKSLLEVEGSSVYCATPETTPQHKKDSTFSGFLYLGHCPDSNLKLLKDFIRTNRIDIIISQYAIDKYNKLFAKVKFELGIKFIVVYHFSPGCEMLSVRNSVKFRYGMPYKTRIKQIIKQLLRPCYLRYKEICISTAINNSYKNCDRFVLLSERFKNDFFNSYSIKGRKDKICAIGNPLSFNDFFCSDHFSCKEKIVLVVARHYEMQKRISLILEIWNNIERLGLLDWKLVLIGEGEDTNNYKLLAQKLDLKNVEFLGKRDPYPYYYKASIFLMTSLYEGFGVTLTEAQQMGVVPIAFNSYASLHDIIKHNHDGIIIENNNIQCFTKELSNLMSDAARRKELAWNAIESSKIFSIESMRKQWLQLFEEVIH